MNDYEGSLNFGRYLKENVRVMKDYWIMEDMNKVMIYDGLVNDGRDFNEKYGVMKDYGITTDIQKEHKELWTIVESRKVFKDM